MSIGGTCYDKMFSGHFAFGLLMTLLAFQHNFVAYNGLNILVAVIVNAMHFIIITATRAHYTMDVMVALYVTLLVNSVNKP